MALKLIGAGFGRTGTLSMKLALEQIGYGPCYHMIEVQQTPGAAEHWYRAAIGEPVDWDEVFRGYVATVDWPACNFYKQLADLYPEAKVLLTVRDPGRWYQSCHNTIFRAMKMEHADAPPAVREQMRMARMLVIDKTFGGDIDDKDHAIAVFNRHSEKVKASIPADRLLVYETGSGWGPLCDFLGVNEPDTPFPRVNTTEDFRSRFDGSDQAEN